jgi:nicotinamidase/pyrazinamidase
MAFVTLKQGDALLLVDPQNDFCPGGSLGVPDGDQVMPVLNEWAAAAEAAGVPVFVSRDWHPPRTTHFKEKGGIWPPHCVAGTKGAEFHATLKLPGSASILSKGMGETEDAYSAFQARDDQGAGLADLLKRSDVRHLYVMGLATDYCVKASTLEGLDKGFAVTVVADGMRAVNLKPNDGADAVTAMKAAGAVVE